MFLVFPNMGNNRFYILAPIQHPCDNVMFVPLKNRLINSLVQQLEANCKSLRNKFGFCNNKLEQF